MSLWFFHFLSTQCSSHSAYSRKPSNISRKLSQIAKVLGQLETRSCLTSFALLPKSMLLLKSSGLSLIWIYPLYTSSGDTLLFGHISLCVSLVLFTGCTSCSCLFLTIRGDSSQAEVDSAHCPVRRE